MSKTSVPEVKLTVIGKSQSGKTVLISRYVEEFFTEPEKTTGSLVSSKIVTDGKRQIKLKICDTPGDEKYQDHLPLYLRGSQGVLICFSVNDRYSFEQVESFLKLAQKECENPYIMVIGTKCDDSEKREVTNEEAETFAQSHGCSYIETSAKAKPNINVWEAFELAGKETFKKAYPKLANETESSCSIF